MTIPEDMMAFIEETARKAAREVQRKLWPSRPVKPQAGVTAGCGTRSCS